MDAGGSSMDSGGKYIYFEKTGYIDIKLHSFFTGVNLKSYITISCIYAFL